MKLTAEEQGERIGWSVKEWNRLNFVTATIPEADPDPRTISSRWTYFVHELRRLYPGLRVIRVLQKHPGGHGWHVHALMDRYISSHVMLHQARLAGLGRMDFQMVSKQKRQNVIGYVSRYVTRDLKKRDKSLKNVRLLTAAGHLRCVVRWWRRYVDLTIEGPYGRLRASLCSICETMGIVLSREMVDSPTLFGLAPPAALAEWRRLNPGLAY
jgi:hypothetical protein